MISKAPHSLRGFTLIEVMIVITIMAILIVASYPSYQYYVRRAHLEDARADLSANARELERYYSKNRTFAGFPSSALKTDQSKNFFTIGFDASSPTANDYRLIATPETTTDETRSLVYDSTSGMLLCGKVENKKANDCEPYY